MPITPTNHGHTSRFPARPYLGHWQICSIQGHTTKRCPSFHLVPISGSHNVNSSYGMTPSGHPQANFTSPSSFNIAPWLLDSGASHHVTADLNNLSLHAPYTDHDDVMIGDGTTLPITHTGSVSLPTLNSSFHLQDVLCVPTMQKNLISIALFCQTNNVSVEIFPTCFHVKDLRTRDILLQGGTKDGVYEWSIASSSSSPILAFSTVKTTTSIWHQRLSHPASSILNHILSFYHLNFSSYKHFCCNAYLSNKSHKLPFSTSTLITSRPLQIIFSDVWTSPIISHDGYKYYVIFVDYFTKYIWFYPLKQKSDVQIVFKRYKAIVEKYFQQNIVSLYSDNGGEYIALKTFLSENGISHLTTPPHTPEHNGFSER
jgi:hypothetical protein